MRTKRTSKPHYFREALLFGRSLMIVIALIVLSSLSWGQQNLQGQHAVFVMTNAADKNEILTFERALDGSLVQIRTVQTGGRGSGGNTDPLESQGSLKLSEDGSLLFAVNAGSGSISVFRVHGTDLSLADRVPSSGSEPNAIAQHGDLVYVLNTGGSSGVAGFRLRGGRLLPISDSIRFLSTNTSGAASLAFSPDGQFLAVTERLTNSIDVFRVLADGTLSQAAVNQAAGPGTFSVVFAPNGAALVAQAGSVSGSAITSYAVLADGTLSPISSNLPTLGAANCWIVVTPDGKFVYNSNAGSSTIAGFEIKNDGSLVALPGTIVGSNPSGATNLDIAVSSDGKFLYTLNTGSGTVGVFAINADGGLSSLGATDGLPRSAGLNGIAAN
jgi:6-phosphogluconolactonase (cycloisomerase 2 family)